MAQGRIVAEAGKAIDATEHTQLDRDPPDGRLRQPFKVRSASNTAAPNVRVVPR